MHQEINNSFIDGKHILEYAPDGIFTIDLNMNIRYVNPAFCNILGCTTKDLLGNSISNYLGDISILITCMQTVKDTGRCMDQETIFQRKDGNMIHISKNVLAMQDEKGNMSGIVVFVRDMTKLHALNKQLTESQEELTKHIDSLEKTLETLRKTQAQLVENEKMASLGNLVAGVAHEVNTPLGISITATTYLHDTVKKLSNSYADKTLTMNELSSTIETFNEIDVILNKNLFRAADLIGSFKKVAVNQTYEEKEKFKLCEILQDLYNSTNHTVKLKHAQLNVVCNDLIIMNSYPSAISQIMINLVMNSLIHGFDENSRNPLIELSVHLENGNINLICKDNGKGMDEITLTKAYEPFYTTARGSGGSGLGLNIVYSLVTQKLKGTIKLDSSLGNGCKFTIIFPSA